MDDFKVVYGPDRINEDSVLIGRGNIMDRIPAGHWKSHVAAATERISARLAFMSDEHHQVRRLVVMEIARESTPVTEAEICRRLKLPQDAVRQILGELESRLFFLVRNAMGSVSWAYPFTAEETPHRIVRLLRRPARAA